MEIELNLNVSKEEFFELIKTSLLHDIKESTGRDVKENKLRKNFSFKKDMKSKLGVKGTVNVKLIDYVEPFKYSVEVKSKQGINTILYKIEEVSDYNINVLYKEEYIATDKVKSLNNSIMSFFYKRRATKRAKKLLHSMEEYIISNREEI